MTFLPFTFLLLILQIKEKELKEKDILLVASKRSIESIQHQCEQQVEEKEAAMATERDEFELLRKEMDEQLREFEQTYDELARERDDLKKRLFAAEGPSLGGRVSTAGSDVSSAELRAAQVRLFVLQEELAHQRRLTAKAQAAQALDAIQAMPSIAARRPLGATLTKATGTVKEANKVCASVMKSLASLRVVNISKGGAGGAKETEQPKAKEGEEQQGAEKAEAQEGTRKQGSAAGAAATLALAAADLKRLQLEAQRARDSLLPVLSNATAHAPTLGAFASVDHMKRVHEAASTKELGTITFPGGAPITAARNNRVFLTPDLFRTLHSALA